jgi:hypothetical protein
MVGWVQTTILHATLVKKSTLLQDHFPFKLHCTGTFPTLAIYKGICLLTERILEPCLWHPLESQLIQETKAGGLLEPKSSKPYQDPTSKQKEKEKSLHFLESYIKTLCC